MRPPRSLQVLVMAVLLCAVGGVALRRALTPPPDLSRIAVRAPLPDAFAPPTRLIPTGLARFAVSPDGGVYLTAIPFKRAMRITGSENFVSPDGRWVLAVRLGLVVATDGSGRVVSATHGMGGDSLWLPDSHRWIDWHFGVSGLVATIHDLDRPTLTRDIPLGHPAGLYGSSGYPQMLGRIGPDRILVRMSVFPEEIRGPTWARFLRARLHLPNSHVRMHFLEFSVGGPGAPAIGQYAVTLPAGVTGADAALSRRGQLAWLLRHTTGERNPCLTAVDLAVSRPDGSRMRIVGRLKIVPASFQAQDSSQLPKELAWLSDGEHVKFVYGDEFWTVRTTP